MIWVKTRFGWALPLALLVMAGCNTPPTVPPLTVPPPVVEAPQRAPRLGLALGGGAARGFAHVGVIQVLEANGIHPDVITGTSAGSLVAALYASGKDATELERAALSMDEATLTDWILPLVSRGLLRGEALARYVRQAVGGKLIEQMKLPLGILATDLGTGQGVLFRRGDAAQAVRASSAVPGVFNPVAIAGREYVDGGLVAPVPVRQAREMGAEVVLAVDISADPQDLPSNGLLSLLPKTTAIMGQSINRLELAGANVVVRPALAGVGSADFTSRQRSIDAGRVAMQAALPRLKLELSRHRALASH
ncbi:patatin-like phospholipase family protein [Hydrogenophaga sp.]|uniref:patatin-like phospholipase family protein n=2 Tax=Hydrogenophaga sp. TaxID=1904254 RepID=UPI0025BD6A98|nr:patatin-like phospholipase family protein [Hydrogenophaga sp.]